APLILDPPLFPYTTLFRSRLAHNTCQTASDLSRRGVLANATRDAKWSREQSDSRNRLLSALISNLRVASTSPQDSFGKPAVFPYPSNPRPRFDRQDSPIITTRQRVFSKIGGLSDPVPR